MSGLFDEVSVVRMPWPAAECRCSAPGCAFLARASLASGGAVQAAIWVWSHEARCHQVAGCPDLQAILPRCEDVQTTEPDQGAPWLDYARAFVRQGKAA